MDSISPLKPSPPTPTLNGAGIQARQRNSAQKGSKLLINLNNFICTRTYTTPKDALTNRCPRQALIALLSKSTHVLDKANMAYRLFLSRLKIPPQLIGKRLVRVSQKTIPLTKNFEQQRNKTFITSQQLALAVL